MLKITLFPTPLYLTLNLKAMPLECGDEVWRQKTIRLSYGEEIMIVGGTMSVYTIHECDRQTVTDGQIYDD